MGTIRRLTPAAGDITLGLAADAYLATLRGAEHASTRRTYGRIIRWIVAEFAGNTAPNIDPERFAAWFAAQWADRSPSTWNVSLVALRAAAAWWMQQRWITADPAAVEARTPARPCGHHRTGGQPSKAWLTERPSPSTQAGTTALGEAGSGDVCRATAILARAQRREVRPNIWASRRSDSGLPACTLSRYAATATSLTALASSASSSRRPSAEMGDCPAA